MSPVVDLLTEGNHRNKAGDANVQRSGSTILDDKPEECDRDRCNEELHANKRWVSDDGVALHLPTRPAVITWYNLLHGSSSAMIQGRS